MANKVITNVDTGSVEIRDGEFVDTTVNFTAAGTYPAGTVLASPGGATTNYPVPIEGALIPWVYSATPTAAANFARAVLTYDVEATGAGDVPVRVLITGVVNKNRLFESTPTTAVKTNINDTVVRQLAANGVQALDVEQLARVDNPQS